MHLACFERDEGCRLPFNLFIFPLLETELGGLTNADQVSSTVLNHQIIFLLFILKQDTLKLCWLASNLPCSPGSPEPWDLTASAS